MKEIEVLGRGKELKGRIIRGKIFYLIGPNAL
jgi:hypothetical protein